MLGKCSSIETSVEEILIDLMDEKVMFAGVHASLMRGLQPSPSTTHQSGPSQTAVEKRSKHRDNLTNVKLILSFLPDYILPLAGTVSGDSVPRYFEYALIIVYDPGGYWWPPTFSKWLKTLSGNFGNLLFLAGFNFRGHFEGLNEGFSRSMFSMIAKGMIEPPK
jgi:hypothetical protein